MSGISHSMPRHRRSAEYRFDVGNAAFVRAQYRGLRRAGLTAFAARDSIIQWLRFCRFTEKPIVSDLPFVRFPLRGRVRQLPAPSGAPVDLPAPEAAA